MLLCKEVAARPGAIKRTLVLALGVISAPGREPIRRTARNTWITLAPADVHVTFVLDERDDQAASAVWAEVHEHGDVLLLRCAPRASVAAFRKAWAWFDWALDAFSDSLYIGKAEDDVYVQLDSYRDLLLAHPILETGSHRTAVPFLIIGPAIQWFSWVPSFGCPLSWAGNVSAATAQAASDCARMPKLCYGPFPFFGGEMVVFTKPVIRALVRSSRVASEALAPSLPSCMLGAVPAAPFEPWAHDAPPWPSPATARELLTRTLHVAHWPLILKKFGNRLGDDIFLGYLLHRHLANESMRLIQLRRPLYITSSKRGDFHAQALVLHDRRKTSLSDVWSNSGALGWQRTGVGSKQRSARPQSNTTAPINDTAWSQVRRAHAYAYVRHCPPTLLRHKLSGRSSICKQRRGPTAGMHCALPPSWHIADVSLPFKNRLVADASLRLLKYPPWSALHGQRAERVARRGTQSVCTDEVLSAKTMVELGRPISAVLAASM